MKLSLPRNCLSISEKVVSSIAHFLVGQDVRPAEEILSRESHAMRLVSVDGSCMYDVVMEGRTLNISTLPGELSPGCLWRIAGLAHL